VRQYDAVDDDIQPFTIEVLRETVSKL